jgi:hypothetical protein
MPAALAPSALRRSGASTLSTPDAIAGSATSHIPSAMVGLASCTSTRGTPGWDGLGDGAGSTATATASAPATTTTAENTGPRPTACANVPSTGPNNAPPIAAASAPPIVLPRRSAGTSPISQVRLPAHVHAPPKPWTKRAASSSRTWSRNANARLDADIRSRPI